MFAPTRSAPVPTITTKNFSRQEHRLLLALFYPHRPFRASKSQFRAESLAISVCGAYTFRKNAKGCLTVKTIPQKLAALALVGALTVSLAGCGVNVTGVALDLPDSMEKGTTLTAVPAYTFDGATPESAALAKKLETLDMHYTSSDPAVVMVDESGCLAALRAGTAEVALSSRDGTITASKTIEVVVTPTGITTTDALTLTAGEAATLETAVAPDDATHVTIRYTSSDNAIATVSDAGEVTAVATGEADITAAVDGTAFSAVCRVTVLPAIESVELNYTALSLRPEGTAQLTYTVAPEEALADDVTYTSSDEAVATVDEAGTVTAVADGTATITVTVNGTAAECEVTVAAKTAAASTNSGSTASADNGGSSAAPDNGSAQESAPAASMQGGALPNGGGGWWSIDSSDSAYWAVANNINAMRAENGLPELTVDGSLSSLATSRCDYQIINDVFTHDGATTAEILLSGAFDAATACSGWRSSPGHYANILTPGYTRMGIGCTYSYEYGAAVWCVTFS